MKERADALLVYQGLARNRTKAKELIDGGQVFEAGRRVTKAGELIDQDKALSVEGQVNPFVSRGGLKLAKAIELFNIDLRGKIVLDIGASTGGFTDCALFFGAAKVYAVDTGYDQLDCKLRNDPRVIVMEKTNARYLTPASLGREVDFATVDVSFISLEKILPVLPSLSRADAQGVALIKPQFEAGPGQVNKKGVLRDARTHHKALLNVLNAMASVGLRAYGLTWSPIKGSNGNIEYLVWFGMKDADPCGAGKAGSAEISPEAIIAEAFSSLR